ncbi:hypothetical protein KEJ15_06885 [Candidatus Bathyarchaeota archaeon]|nr:hypothetical protein [Candidatus Bathyarchaeota archaeon]
MTTRKESLRVIVENLGYFKILGINLSKRKEEVFQVVFGFFAVWRTNKELSALKMYRSFEKKHVGINTAACS